MELPKNIKIWLIGLSLFVLLLTPLIYKKEKSDDEIFWKKFHKEYVLTETIDSISGMIVRTQPAKGAVGVILNDSSKFRFRSSFNFNYRSHHKNLLDNCKVGNRIFKRSGSDTIYVFEENEKHYYIHGKFIHRKMDIGFKREDFFKTK